MLHHRALLWKIARPVLRLYWRIRRPLTAGVRGIVFDAEGRVLLIRHTYVAGWCLPGGGVERGETMLTAPRGQCDEEVGVTMSAEVRLIGLYATFRESKSIQVGLCAVAAGTYDHAPRRSPEIAEGGLFPLAALPDGVTPSTHRRIAEATGKL